jgi:polar amino acid transport system substrate-binding protein
MPGQDFNEETKRFGMRRRQVLLGAVASLGAVPSLGGVTVACAADVKKVGSTATGIPFTFLDTKTNTIQGVMVDIATEVGKRSGFPVEIEPMQFSTLIAALTTSKIDLISAAMYITPVRQQQVNFSDPIYTYGEGLFVPKSDTKDYVSFDDMKGYTVGAQVGTAYIEPLKKVFGDVKVYDTIPDIMRDVNAKRIQAGFADSPIVAYNLQLGNFPDVRLVKTYKSTIVGSIGIAVRKDDPDLLAKVNAALAAMKTDGTIRTILAKWGLS